MLARGPTKSQPAPSEFEALHCVPLKGHITCGNKPALFARIVRNLKATLEPDGEESLTWEEIEDEDILPVRRPEAQPGT
jgi:hypothetical protein